MDDTALQRQSLRQQSFESAIAGMLRDIDTIQATAPDEMKPDAGMLKAVVLDFAEKAGMKTK